MTASRIPIYFQQVVEELQLGSCEGTEGTMGVHKVAPLAQKLPSGRSDESCVKTIESHGVSESLSAAIRHGAEGLHEMFPKIPEIGGVSAVGFNMAMGAPMGVLGVYNNYKSYKKAVDIQDDKGKGLSILEGIENGTLAVGSGTCLGLKMLTTVQEIGAAAHHPIALAGTAATVQGVFSWFSGVVSMLYYVLHGIRTGLGLIDWYQGFQWKKELLKKDDPRGALYEQLRARIYNIDLTPEEELKEGIKAGARWLEKIEKASEGRIKIANKEEAFQQLILANPELIREFMGEWAPGTSAAVELQRFGRYMVIQNECAKFEVECRRKLGEKTIEALKTGKKEDLKKSLEVTENWSLALKAVAAVVGLAAVIAILVLVTGSPLGVLLFLAGIAAVAMLVLVDGEALKNHFASGEFKKRDRYLVYSALVLSAISLVSVMALTIATGGVALYAVSLVFAITWFCINTYSAHLLWSHDQRPWKAKKELDLATYRRFLESNPTADQIEEIKNKIPKGWEQLTLDKINKITQEEQKKLECMIDKAMKTPLHLRK